jgi:hypothetical protein
MEVQRENISKFDFTPLEARVIFIEYSIISFILDALAASDDNVNQEIYRVFILGFIDHACHVYSCQYSIQSQCPTRNFGSNCIRRIDA